MPEHLESLLHQSDTEFPGNEALINNQNILSKELEGVGSAHSFYEPSERGAISLEFIGRGLDYAALAVNGLRRAVTEKRLEHNTALVDDLETSADVHRHVAEIMQTPVAQKPVVAGFDSSLKLFSDLKNEISSSQTLDPNLAPLTYSQRRNARLAAKRESSAIVMKSGKQYRLERVWGDDIVRPEYKDRVEGERARLVTKRHAKRAYIDYTLNEEKIDKSRELVDKSAEGIDLPGKVLEFRQKRAIKREKRLLKKLDKLSRARADRTS